MTWQFYLGVAMGILGSCVGLLVYARSLKK